MITTLTFTDLGSNTINLNSDPPGYTVHDYDVTVQDRVTTDRGRNDEQGAWPTVPREGGMEIHCEGDILAANSDAYQVLRKAMVTAFRNDVLPITRRRGRLTVRYDGETEDWYADVIVVAFSAPRGPQSPARSSWACTFFSFKPYFIGATSGDPYYDA